MTPSDVSVTGSTPAATVHEPAFSPPRVAPRFGTAFGGILRLTWARRRSLRGTLISAGLLAALAVLTSLVLQEDPHHGLSDWADLVVLAVIPIWAFLAGAGAVREDLKPGAVDYIVTRPVPRWAYVIFKYIAQATVGIAVSLAIVGTVVAVGLFHGASLEDALRWCGVALAGMAAFLALGFLCGALTSRYLVLGLLYAGLVEAVVGNIPIQLNRLSIQRHLNDILDAPVGDFAGMAASSGGIALIVVILVGVAAVLFSKREFIGGKANQG